MNDIWSCISSDPSFSYDCDNRHYRFFENGQTLSILSQTEVPLVSSDKSDCGKHHIILEADIYNMQELRALLPQKTIPEEVNDTVVFLRFFLHFGAEGLNKVNGMFSFVIWDGIKQILTAGRDRFGMKTVYWTKTPTSISFSNRMSSLATLASGKFKANHTQVIGFLIHGFTDYDTNTVFDGVNQLASGTVMSIPLVNWQSAKETKTISKWYLPNKVNTNNRDDDDLVNEFHETFSDAVRIRHGTGKKAGLMYSGGLDSSVILGLLSKQNSEKERPKTFKALWNIPRYDEQKAVNQAISLTKAEHKASAVEAMDAFAYRDRLIDIIEAPYQRSLLCGHMVVHELMEAHGIEATLDGLGADDQLGGSPRMIQNFEDVQNQKTMSGFGFLSEWTSYSGLDEKTDLNKEFAWLNTEPRQSAIKLVHQARQLVITDFKALCRHKMAYGALPQLLRYNRDIGRAFGMSTRSPYLDHRLVELSLSLDSSFKMNKGRSKYILRKAAAGIVPEYIIKKDDKISLTGIETTWLNTTCRERLISETIQTLNEWPNLFNVNLILSRIKNEDSDRVFLLMLWRITCFGAWTRKFSISHLEPEVIKKGESPEKNIDHRKLMKV